MDDLDDLTPAVDPAASRRVFLGMLALVAGAGLAYAVLRPAAPPPPPDVARDPLLAKGREVYLDRCASCHGPSGKGDGPTGKILTGPPPGDLTDDEWKH